MSMETENSRPEHDDGMTNRLKIRRLDVRFSVFSFDPSIATVCIARRSVCRILNA